MKTTFIFKILLVLIISTAMSLTPVFAKEIVLNAKKITEKKTPQIDGKVDKIWNKAKRAKIVVKGDGKIEVNAKVLYTNKDIYFLFEWKDKTESLNRYYTFQKGKWEKKKGNEDRLNVAWDIKGNIKDFNKKGCNILCHKGDDESAMLTNRPEERVDLWHWKAQRTNPVGYADEQYIQHIKSDDPHEPSGRRSDKKDSGGYSSNWDKAKSRPFYIGTGKGGAILLKAKAQKVTDSTVFTEGMIAPREVLQLAIGSRGDLEAKGVWKKGKWTLEFKRALNTGHDDDVQFTDLKKVHFFGVSVHENGDGDDHAIAIDVAQLRFK